jgi:hypothetical protein
MPSNTPSQRSPDTASNKALHLRSTLGIVALVFVIAAIGLGVWAFSFKELERHHYEILRFMFSVAAGIAAGAFAGSISISSDKIIPGVAISAAGGFAVWLLCFVYLFPATVQAPTKVMLMDSTLHGLVYDTETRKQGGTNSDDITEVLDDLGLQLIAEKTSLAWRREDQVRSLAPELIIIHLSCFYEKSNPGDSDEKFRGFLDYMRDTDTKFIVYTRGLHGDVPPQVRERWKTQKAFLKSVFPAERLQLFMVKGDEDVSFRDATTGRKLKQLVKSMLDLDHADR